MKRTIQLTIFLIILKFSNLQFIHAQVVNGEIDDYHVYTIENDSSKYLMEVAGNIFFNEKYKDHSLIVQQSASFDEDNQPNKWQRWHIIYEKTEEGVRYFSIRNAMSGKYLDVPDGVTTDGIQLQQYAASLDLQEDEQLWQIIEKLPGKYKVLNKKTGLALTAADETVNSPVAQSAFVGSSLQQWNLTQLEPCSYRDDEVVRFFERNDHNSGSTAFDQGSSILLSNGQILWVTQDSWDGWELTDNNLFCSNYFFNYGNSMFLQPSLTNWNPDDAPNITRENSAQDKPRQICDIQPNQTFAWPSNGVELNGRVYLNCGEGSGLSAEGQTIYEIWPNQEGSLEWNSVRHEISTISSYNKIIYSAGMVTANDGYVYVFGARIIDFGAWYNLYVARFSVGSPLTSWTFWNGTSWVNNPPANDPELEEASVYKGKGASVAVSFVNGKYVVVSLDQGFWETTEHYIRAATCDSPTGLYSPQKKVYDICEHIYGTQARYYTPNIHPEFDNEKNELLVTYSLNYAANDAQDITVDENGKKIVNGDTVTEGGYIDPYFYRVKGVRIPYSVLDIPADYVQEAKSVKSAENQIEFFPAPARDNLFIKSGKSIKGALYQIYDVKGVLVDSGKIQDNKINVNALSNGMYFLNLTVNESIVTQKFIKG